MRTIETTSNAQELEQATKAPTIESVVDELAIRVGNYRERQKGLRRAGRFLLVLPAAYGGRVIDSVEAEVQGKVDDSTEYYETCLLKLFSHDDEVFTLIDLGSEISLCIDGLAHDSSEEDIKTRSKHLLSWLESQRSNKNFIPDPQTLEAIDKLRHPLQHLSRLAKKLLPNNTDAAAYRTLHPRYRDLTLVKVDDDGMAGIRAILTTGWIRFMPDSPKAASHRYIRVVEELTLYDKGFGLSIYTEVGEFNQSGEWQWIGEIDQNDKSAQEMAPKLHDLVLTLEYLMPTISAKKDIIDYLPLEFLPLDSAKSARQS